MKKHTLPFKVKDIWFNGFEEISAFSKGVLGGLQGKFITSLIDDKNLPHNKHFSEKPVVVNDYDQLTEIK